MLCFSEDPVESVCACVCVCVRVCVCVCVCREVCFTSLTGSAFKGKCLGWYRQREASPVAQREGSSLKIQVCGGVCVCVCV